MSRILEGSASSDDARCPEVGAPYLYAPSPALLPHCPTSNEKAFVVSLPKTLKARTDLTGLPVGAPCFFRVRRSTKVGALDWSDPVRLFVT